MKLAGQITVIACDQCLWGSRIGWFGCRSVGLWCGRVGSVPYPCG